MRLRFCFSQHFPPLLWQIFAFFSRLHSPPRVCQFGCESSVRWIAIFPPAALRLSAGSVTAYLLIQVFVTSFRQFRYWLAGPRFSLRTIVTLSCQVASVSPALLWEVFSRRISGSFDCWIEIPLQCSAVPIPFRSRSGTDPWLLVITPIHRRTCCTFVICNKSLRSVSASCFHRFARAQ